MRLADSLDGLVDLQSFPLLLKRMNAAEKAENGFGSDATQMSRSSGLEGTSLAENQWARVWRAPARYPAGQPG